MIRQALEAPGIRLHMPGEAGTTVIAGLGEGTGLQGHSPWDRYVILRRSGRGGRENRFLGVLEPFSGEPYLGGIEPLILDGRAAGKGRLTLSGKAGAQAFEGKPFYVYDVGPGDRWRIPVARYVER